MKNNKILNCIIKERILQLSEHISLCKLRLKELKQKRMEDCILWQSKQRFEAIEDMYKKNIILHKNIIKKRSIELKDITKALKID